MEKDESPLDRAKRNVRDGEAHIRRQQLIIDRMEPTESRQLAETRAVLNRFVDSQNSESRSSG